MGSAFRIMAEVRRLSLACLFAVVVSVPLAIGLLGLNFASQSINRAPIRNHVAEAIAAGDFKGQEADAVGLARGADPWNDCAVMSLVLDQEGRAIERALAPRWAPAGGVCTNLARSRLRQDVPAQRYPRYMHGLVAFAAPLAALMPIEEARSVMERVSVLTALGLCGLALLGMRRATRRGDRLLAIRAVFALGAGAVFLLCFGLGDFGMTFTHFPTAMTLMAFVVLGLMIDFGRLKPAYVLAAHAVLGVFIAWFEFLTGGLAMAACLILYMAAAWSRGLADLWRAIRCLAAFLTAFLTTFAVKMALTVAVIGRSVVADFGANLATRMAGAEGAEPVDIIDTVAVLLFHARYVGAGSDALGKMLIVGSVLAMGWGAFVVVRRRLAGDALVRPLLLGGAFAVIGAWHLLFFPHSHQHAWFMVRTLAGLILPAVMLLAWLHRKDLAAVLTGVAGMMRR